MHHSARLTFEIPTQADFDEYFSIYADPQTNLFNPKGPMTMELAPEHFAKFITHWQEHQFGSWTIREKGRDELIGFGGLSYRFYGTDLRLNLGYRFSPAAWGKGYATELSLYSINYGFNQLQVDTIFAIVRPAHAVSIKVLQKCGMKFLETLDDVPGEAPSLVYIIENKNQVSFH